MDIAELAALMSKAHQLEAETKKYDLSDDALDPILEARDKTEDAVTEAVTEILGDPPEWSSLYDYEDAYWDCEAKLRTS